MKARVVEYWEGRRVEHEVLEVVLVSPGGLGDQLASIVLGYHLVWHGYKVHLSTEEGRQVGLPVVPVFEEVEGKEIKVRELPGFIWNSPRPFLPRLLDSFKKPLASIPGYPVLKTRTASPELPRPYALLAPQGRYYREYKEISAEQVAVISRLLAARHYYPVVVGDRPLGYNIPALDLTTSTDWEELIALVEGAALVVSIDTGILHLAAAFNRPTLALASSHTIRKQGFPFYYPFLWLNNQEFASRYDIDLIEEALNLLIDSIETSVSVVVPDRTTCGVADSGRRTAEAANLPVEVLGSFAGTRKGIGEYHPYDRPLWLKSNTSVLAIHQLEGGLPYAPEVVAFRSRPVALKEGFYQAPLLQLPALTEPPDSLPEPPNRIRHIYWHGIVHKGKGLDVLVRAFQEVKKKIPDATLTLLASKGDSAGGRTDYSDLLGLKVDGVVVKGKPYWSRAELIQELSRAHLFCYPDLFDAEQSAASTDVLGFSRPIVVSESTKHLHLSPWVWKVRVEKLADALILLMTDDKYYKAACRKSWLGAHFHSPSLVGRQYRALAIQSIINQRSRCLDRL